MTDRGLLLGAEVGSRHVRSIYATGVGAVEIQDPRTGLSDVARRRAQHRGGAKRVSAKGLTLHALAQPHEGWSLGINLRRRLDLGRRHLGSLFPPFRRTCRNERLDFLPSDDMVPQEFLGHQSFALNDVEHGEGERGVAPRTELQEKIGPARRRVGDGIDYDGPAWCLGQPVLMHVRSRRGWIGAPHEDARRVLGRPGIETAERGSEYVFEGLVSGVVANRVRIHFRRPEAVKKAQGKCARDQ